MQYLSNAIKWALAGFSALIGFLFGEWNGLMLALVALIILDYISGIIVAIITKKLSSKIGAKGIAKKILIMLIVMIANIIDVNVIGSSGILKTATIIFYIANEGISLLENGAKLGIPLPKKLIDILVQLKETNKDSEGQKADLGVASEANNDILVENNEKE